ncbi:MAG: branched-chain amino acid ABC transporter permease [Candidatus Rokubacteria bacterium]|nr:branched-chain amino acid ABC transporter permease [Candidatus Rokubacteria bacterium]
MNYVLYVVSLVGVYGILAVSLNLVLGYTGILSVAHAAFMGIGAYTAALLLTGWGFNFFFTLPVGLAMAGLVGAALAASTLRLRGDYYIIGSFGFQVIMYNVFLNWIDLTKGPFGIRNIPKPQAFGVAFDTPARYAVLTLAFLVVSVWVARRVGESPYGKVLRAIREDEAGAASIGKNVRRYKISIFVVSSMLASLGGALYAGLISYVDPFAFTIHESIFLQALVIVGGSGNVYGSVVGAAVLITIPEMLRFLDVPTTVASPIREILYGALMILFLRFRPKGLLPERVSPGVGR